MTYLHNDPKDFAAESHEGFALANSAWVAPIRGGVVRRSKTAAGQVAVVVGGGSGHYPAFGGLVGPGLAHGAAMGNVFASPSAQQVYNVAKAAENGGGILLSYGNYAGDVLNFNQAQERLRQDGFEVETVFVTDDIASASKEEIHKRRGIAGDLAVFKAAAWAAESGMKLQDVKRVAAKANDRVRTIGVAFSGCTLPGATAPLFKVDPGVMEVGMGIHGEPGLYKIDRPTADELAKILTDQIFSDVPDGVDPSSSKAAVILSGLGSVKYEELFVLYRKVHEIIAGQGVSIVEPDVGELVTSFDMAGVSLTLFWLDEELEKAWRAPASTPAYRKGAVSGTGSDNDGEEFDPTQIVQTLIIGSSESQASAEQVAKALFLANELIDREVEELGRIDSIAGDGDHGIGMQRGVQAATDAARGALSAKAGASSLLFAAADAWADKAGGTSGVIWGVILSSIAAEMNNQDKVSSTQIAKGLSKALENVKNFGKATLGDKTLVDALEPFVLEFNKAVDEGSNSQQAWSRAAEVAIEAAEATKQMLPKVGRARPHAEKSLGTPDPGALSLALIAKEIERVWA